MEETMKSHNSNKAAKKLRQQGALERLKAQKAAGNKPEKLERNGKHIISNNTVDLSKHDLNRIDKEINTLTSKLSYAGK